MLVNIFSLKAEILILMKYFYIEISHGIFIKHPISCFVKRSK